MSDGVDPSPGRRLHRLGDPRLLRRMPWRAADRKPILDRLGIAQAPAVNVKALRMREGLSREDFARVYGLPADSIRAWERGASPTAAARVALAMIEAHPHLVRRVLGVKG
jgi:hypothetical protein